MSNLHLAAECVAYTCLAGTQLAGVLAGILWAATGVLFNPAFFVACGFAALSAYLFHRIRSFYRDRP